MAHPIAKLLTLSAVLGALVGCAALPATGGGVEPGPSAQAAAAPLPFQEPGWLLLGRTEGASVYIHPRSTLRVGSSAFIMVMAAKHQPVVLPDGARIGSLKERYEIDCAGQRYRRHDGTAHPDQAALGPVLGQVGQDQWRGINPDTVMAVVSTAACADTAVPDMPNVAPPGPVLRSPRNPRATFRT